MSTMPGTNQDNQGMPQPPPPPGQEPAQQQQKASSGGGIIGWIRDSYNGLYRIVVAPSMPKWSTIILLIVGFFIGILWGYVVQPPIFNGANPNRLNQPAQDQWVRMAAVGFDPAARYNQQALADLLNRIDDPQATVQRLIEDGSTSPTDRGALQTVANNIDLAALEGSETPTSPGLVQEALTGLILPLLLILVVTPILFVVWRLLFYPNLVAPVVSAIRRRFNPAEREAYAASQDELKRQREMAAARKQLAGAQVARQAGVDLGDPVMRQLSIYSSGRSYDDSFEIELADGSFLGQCGATIAEAVAPDPVAIEVWLFDMGTSQNPAKVFMTETAYNDAAIRARVEAGLDDPNDIEVAKVGEQLTLETPKLRLMGEMKSLDVQADGRFGDFQMTLFAWQKGAEPAPAPGGPPPVPPTPAARPMSDYDDIQFDPPPAPSGQGFDQNQGAPGGIGDLLQEHQEETIPNDPLPPYRPNPWDQQPQQQPDNQQNFGPPAGMSDFPTAQPPSSPAFSPPEQQPWQQQQPPAGLPGAANPPGATPPPPVPSAEGQQWGNFPPPPGMDDDYKDDGNDDDDDPFGTFGDFRPRGGA